MQLLITLLVYIIVFAIVAFGLSWVCDKFGLPQPVKWICGAILLVIILVFVAGQLGDGGVSFPRLR
jgi:uncharacterized membrane protein YcjF (UPF0283 family)